MEWFNQLRFSLFRLNNFCDRCTNPVSRNLFWDWRDSETFAEEEDAEDLCEDSLSEVLEEISPHVEEKKEDKSAGVEEERENMPDDKVEEKELTTFSNAKEKEEVVTKVHGLFNSAPPSKDQQLLCVDGTPPPSSIYFPILIFLSLTFISSTLKVLFLFGVLGLIRPNCGTFFLSSFTSSIAIFS